MFHRLVRIQHRQIPFLGGRLSRTVRLHKQFHTSPWTLGVGHRQPAEREGQRLLQDQAFADSKNLQRRIEDNFVQYYYNKRREKGIEIWKDYLVLRTNKNFKLTAHFMDRMLTLIELLHKLTPNEKADYYEKLQADIPHQLAMQDSRSKPDAWHYLKLLSQLYVCGYRENGVAQCMQLCRDFFAHHPVPPSPFMANRIVRAMIFVRMREKGLADTTVWFMRLHELVWELPNTIISLPQPKQSVEYLYRELCKNPSNSDLLDQLSIFMEKRGIQMSGTLYSARLRFLTRRGEMAEAKKLFHEMVRLGLAMSHDNFECLVYGSLMVPSYRVTRQSAFNVAPNDTYAWTRIPQGAGASKEECLAEADYWVQQMKAFGLTPSTRISTFFMTFYARHNDYDEMTRIYTEMGEKATVVAKTTMLKYYFAIRDVKKAMELYLAMVQQGDRLDPILTAVLMTGLSQNNLPEEALKYFAAHREAGYPISYVNYAIVMSILCKMKDMGPASKLYDEFIAAGHVPNEAIICTFIKGYALLGDLEHARHVFDSIESFGFSPGIASYNTLMDAYISNNEFEAALETYRAIKRGRIPEDWRTAAMLINLHAKRNREEDMIAAYRRYKELGFPVSGGSINPLVWFYSFQGNLPLAFEYAQVLIRAAEKNPHLQTDTYHAHSIIVTALSLNPMYHSFIDKFVAKLLEEKKKPDPILSQLYLQSLGARREKEKLEVFFNDYVLPNIQLTKLHYTTYIWALYKVGLYGKALVWLNNMTVAGFAIDEKFAKVLKRLKTVEAYFARVAFYRSWTRNKQANERRQKAKKARESVQYVQLKERLDNASDPAAAEAARLKILQFNLKGQTKAKRKASRRGEGNKLREAIALRSYL
ncbi:hypothetical protein HDU91_000538, partial [Kappamyces sp. JEL0680]